MNNTLYYISRESILTQPKCICSMSTKEKISCFKILRNCRRTCGSGHSTIFDFDKNHHITILCAH